MTELYSVMKLNSFLIKIADIKNTLNNLEYSHTSYDYLETELHTIEDEMLQEFEPLLKEALHLIHDKFCKEEDILSPLAYIAPNYIKRLDETYFPEHDSGVKISLSQYPNTETKLVLVPGPARFVLLIGQTKQKTILKFK